MKPIPRITLVALSVLWFVPAIADEDIPPPPVLIPNPPPSEGNGNFFPIIKSLQIEQPLDHSNPHGPKFRQNIFIETQFARDPTTAPVLYSLCGEQSKCPSEADLSIRRIALKQGAVVVWLEHRYYGESKAVARLNPKNLKFLNVEQALADTKNAQDFVQRKMRLQGPWVVTGCSYPGALAAFYRATYPKLVKGALVSSAPVVATSGLPYGAAVVASLGAECVDRVRSALKDMEQMLNGSPESLTSLRGKLGYKRVREADAVLNAVRNDVVLSAQHGYSAQLCTDLKTSPFPADGLTDFIRKKNSISSQASESELWGGGLSLQSADFDDPEVRTQLAWTYQTCTELGLQNAYDCVESDFFQKNFFANESKLCRDSVQAIAGSRFKEFNEKFFKKLLDSKTKNILFITGSEDPFRLASLRPDNNTNPGLTTLSVSGGSHCSELHGNSSAEDRAFQRMEELFGKWTSP